MNLLKNVFFFPIPFIVVLIFYSCAPPSNFREQPYRQIDSKKEKFFTDPLFFFDTDSLKSRMDLYLEIPSENILFKKDVVKDKYEYKLSISAVLYNSVNEKIIEGIYNQSSEFSDDEMKKVSKESQYYFYNYNIDPGNYKLEIKINDYNSKSEYKTSLDIQVKDFTSGEITFSDIMILSKYKITENGSKEITPLISKNIFGLKEFFIFFEIYNNSKSDVSKEYLYRLKDNKGIIIKEEVLTYVLTPGKNHKVENVFVLRELKKYLPEEPDFDFFLYDNEQNIYFTIEIIDKSNAEIVAGKKLNFIPGKTKFDFNNKPRMR